MSLRKQANLIIQDAGFYQSNIRNDIVSHKVGILFSYTPQVCQEPIYVPTTNPITTSDQTLAPIVQPEPSANVSTNTASTIIPILIRIIQKMQQLMVHMKANQLLGGGQNNNPNTCCLLTLHSGTKTRQGQPHKPLPDFSTKYFWTHGNCAHERAACNNKSLNHKDTVTLCNKLNGITYGYT